MNQTIDYYNKNASEFCAGTIQANMSDLYAPFLAYVPNGKILDCGCGSGRDSKFFLEKGYLVDAIDASEELCQYASAYTGLNVQHMTFAEIQAESIYDGIWACASLLHVPEDELPEIMVKLDHALKPAGILYASFKYGDSAKIRNGRFFTDMNEQRLSSLLQKSSVFETEKLWVTGDVREGRENEKWLNLLLRKV